MIVFMKISDLDMQEGGITLADELLALKRKSYMHRAWRDPNSMVNYYRFYIRETFWQWIWRKICLR